MMQKKGFFIVSISYRTVPVYGLPYLDADHDELRKLLASRLRDCPSTTIFTPNAKMGADCLATPELHLLLSRADLLLPDGAGVLMASRRQTPDHPLTHRLPGIEAGETVLRLCADMGLPVYFLGGRPTVAALAAAAWKKRLPSLLVAGSHDGYFEKSGKENEAVIQEIDGSGAAVILVCFGFPIQERWIVENRDALPRVRMLMGLGGSFDVWAGKVRRAPRIIQVLHLEWLWRSVPQPWRLKALPAMVRYALGRSKE